MEREQHSYVGGSPKAIHKKLKVEHASPKVIPNRLKVKKEDEEQAEEEDSEAAELRICGAKCRNIPPTIRAKFIKTMFED